MTVLIKYDNNVIKSVARLTSISRKQRSNIRKTFIKFQEFLVALISPLASSLISALVSQLVNQLESPVQM